MITITLPARCDRAAATAMLPDFVAALGNERIEVDASGVELAGHAMLQLLASARNSFAQMTIAASAPLVEAARLTGLHAHLFEGSEQ
jgi:hypothetical protein